ncbi:MAG TPA: cysteine--tRNA ligase, partial [Candidatus Doudnabacteria bacterium]|nr:cysteine--tRNA ligase [Candidatus Doudnabacteria bacterium]
HQHKDQLASYEAILGIGLDQATAEIEIPNNVQILLDQRAAAREAKDFAESDRLREKIAELGFEVLDTSDGQKVMHK